MFRGSRSIPVPASPPGCRPGGRLQRARSGPLSVQSGSGGGQAGGEYMAEPKGATALQAQGELLRLVIGENNADLAVTLTLLLNAEPDIRCVATVSSTTDRKSTRLNSSHL